MENKGETCASTYCTNCKACSKRIMETAEAEYMNYSFQLYAAEAKQYMLHFILPNQIQLQ